MLKSLEFIFYSEKCVHARPPHLCGLGPGLPPSSPLWCDLGLWSRTVVAIKLRRTSAVAALIGMGKRLADGTIVQARETTETG